MPIEHRQGYLLWEGGPVAKGADGITLGSLVIVRHGKATPYLFWRLRGKDHRSAYLRIPLEIEADWVARRSLTTAVRDELPERIAS